MAWSGFRPASARLLGGLGLVALTAACSSDSGPTAAQVVRNVQSAVAGAASVHYVDSTLVGTQSQVSTADVSATAARVVQVVGRTPELEVRLVGTTAYVDSASASVLQSALGLSPGIAQVWTGRWISVTQADSPYAAIVESVSITGEINPLLPDPNKAALGTVAHFSGIPVWALNETVSQSGAGADLTVLVSKKTSLPVAISLVARKASNEQRKQVVFTRWNQPVRVDAPTGATPLSTLVSA
jgi:hypothetical protein